MAGDTPGQLWSKENWAERCRFFRVALYSLRTCRDGGIGPPKSAAGA